MELNCITGEVTYRELTDAQIAQQKLDQAEAKVQAKVVADKAKAKQAVLTKLGLTADEVTALLG
jgi:hypothetical protein